jgi:hypothetical protein
MILQILLLFLIGICCYGSFLLTFLDAIGCQVALELELEWEDEEQGFFTIGTKEKREITFLAVTLAVLFVTLIDFVWFWIGVGVRVMGQELQGV